MDENGNQIGGVSVEVSADLDKLIKGFSDGRAEQEKFNRDAERSAAKAGEKIGKAYEKGKPDLAKSFDPARPYAGIKASTALEMMRIEAAATKKNADETDALTKAQLRLQRSYAPLKVAMASYERDLKDIERLQKAGRLNAAQAAEYSTAATLAYQRTQQKVQSQNRMQTTGGVGRVAGGVLTAAIITQTVGGFSRMASSALEYAQSLGDVAENLGLTTDQLQEYRFAASKSGVSEATLERGIANLNKTLGRARSGSKSDIAAFKALSNVLGQDIVASAKNAGDALPMIADGVAKLHDPTERAAILNKLLGESGQKMTSMLSGGSAKIDELREAAHRLGIVLSEKEIQKANETANKLAELKKVLAVKVASAVVANAESIYTLASALAALAGAALNVLPKIARVQYELAKLSPFMNAQNLGTYFDVLPSGDKIKAASDAAQRLNEATEKLRSAQQNPNQRSRSRLVAQAQKEVEDAKAYALHVRSGIRSLIPQSTPAAPAGEGLGNFLAGNDPKGRTSGLSDYDRLFRKLTEDAAALNAELQALNENLPDSEVDAAKMKAELYAEVLDKSRKMTDAQRQALLGMVDALIKVKTGDYDAARIREQSTEGLKEYTGGINDAKRAQEALTMSMDRAISVHEKYREEFDREGKTPSLKDAYGADIWDRMQTNATGAIEAIGSQTDAYFDRINSRTDELSDGIADAFAGIPRDILAAKSALEVLSNFVGSLAAEFQKAFIIDPIRDWAKSKIGDPVAKKLMNRQGGEIQFTGFNTGLNTATTSLSTFTSALQSASLAAGTGAGGLLPSQGGFGAPSDIPDVLGALPTASPDVLRLQAINDNLSTMASATSQATAAYAQQVPVIGQFGSGLMQVLSSLSGGGGGGGLLGTVLGLGKMFAGSVSFGGSGLGGAASLSSGMQSAISTPLVDFNAMAAPIKFAGGGAFDGLIKGPGTGTSDSIPAMTDGGNFLMVSNEEFIINAESTKKHRNLLESINEDRIPKFAGGGSIGDIAAGLVAGRDTGKSSQMTWNGDVVINGARDERDGRRIGKVAAKTIQNEIARSSRTGTGG